MHPRVNKGFFHGNELWLQFGHSIKLFYIQMGTYDLQIQLPHRANS